MGIRSTLFEQNETFYIAAFGYEDVSANAHWGRGRRDFFILHYVLAGEGFFNGNKVSSGKGFFIYPGQLHEYHSSENAPWKYLWVIFGGSIAADICKKYIKTDPNGIFEFDFRMDVRNLRDSMFSEMSPLPESKALSYFFGLLSFHERKSVITGNRYVDAAKKYMNMHFYRNITVAEVASSIGINDRYLYNLFVTYEHISPKKYLSRLRLNSAKSMLANTDATISEIAVSSGFPDVLTFSRFFSKNMKLSPTAYRRSIQ